MTVSDLISFAEIHKGGGIPFGCTNTSHLSLYPFLLFIMTGLHSDTGDKHRVQKAHRKYISTHDIIDIIEAIYVHLSMDCFMKFSLQSTGQS